MATIKYQYKCVSCGHLYLEQRNDSEQQFFTKCNVCGENYEEVSHETVE